MTRHFRCELVISRQSCIIEENKIWKTEKEGLQQLCDGVHNALPFGDSAADADDADEIPFDGYFGQV